MYESKLTYIALALGAGAIAISVASAGLSALPNSTKIDTLAGEVRELRELNATLQEQLKVANQNRTRIDELDIGLTAMASVMNIDRQELAKAMMDMKAGRAPGEPKATAGAVTPKALQGQIAAPQQPTIKPDAPASVPEAKPAVDAPVKAATPMGSTTVKPADGVSVDAPVDEDNPFAGAPDTSVHAGGEVPAPLAIVPAEAPKLTIEHVDSILAKRISEKWYKPAGATSDLNAIIQMKMTREGKVESVVLSRPSGNAEFDTSVINAVKSIGAIDEVQRLSDADFEKAYANRNIQFTPQMGG